MQELIKLATKDVAAEQAAFDRAVKAYRDRKDLRKKFPKQIRDLKIGIKALNRAGVSCKLLQLTLTQVRDDLAFNEEVLEQIAKSLQSGYLQLQARKEVLEILKKEGK